MNLKATITTILLILFCHAIAVASDAGGAGADVTVDDFAFIAGRWQAEAFGGVCEEVWSPPSGGSMMGMFKLVKDGRVVFYELITIAEDSSGLAMKLKHFNADLTGWEEKDKVQSFPLVKLAPDEALFEGLVYRLTHPDTLQVILTTEHDGQADTTEFLFHRMRE